VNFEPSYRTRLAFIPPKKENDQAYPEQWKAGEYITLKHKSELKSQLTVPLRCLDFTFEASDMDFLSYRLGWNFN